MIILLNSFLLVAATEMGDKTQLLAFILASRFRQPWHVMAGILTATILDHALASTPGKWLGQSFDSHYLKWILAACFFAFAFWILKPDDDEGLDKPSRFGAFITTTILFFMAEMGDKTQLSTLALAARYQDLILVTTGTTLGMLFSDGLAVIFGEKLTKIVPMHWIRRIAALLFILSGIAILME